MRRLTSSPKKALRARAGFTLAELLVALMVFSVGALAMTATAANVITLMTASKNRTQAADVAEARFEKMRAQACASHTSDSTVTEGVAESWQTVSLARADDVTVRVRFMSNRRQNTRIYRSFLSCP
ncbi:MAG TPA: prepilin-type N-terminal cleavage/methylation domain-containing protein [Gemmatimonadaceae bacterium]|jgi:prepilin-type N-terminal cleavage/methylation domain-containing protein|nr:prepilin-type N-terminal cleavage/methylation domain-containing protein [Gemmatimonadaceae bacterium]